MITKYQLFQIANLYKEVAWGLFELIFVFFIINYFQTPQVAWLFLLPLFSLTKFSLFTPQDTFYPQIMWFTSAFLLGTAPFGIFWILSPSNIWFLSMTTLASFGFILYLFLLFLNIKKIIIIQNHILIKFCTRLLCLALIYLFLVPIILILFHLFKFQFIANDFFSVINGLNLLSSFIHPYIIYSLLIVPFCCIGFFSFISYKIKQILLFKQQS